jgi:hypothetical protein
MGFAEVAGMSTMKVQAIVEADGELHLKGLPYRKGDRVEALLQVADEGEDRRREREAALQQFLELTKKSTFRSTGPYPTRDELHERG